MNRDSGGVLGVLAAVLLAAVVGLVVYVVVVRSKEAQAVDNWSAGIGLAEDLLGTFGGLLGGVVGGGAAGLVTA